MSEEDGAHSKEKVFYVSFDRVLKVLVKIFAFALAKFFKGLRVVDIERRYESGLAASTLVLEPFGIGVEHRL